ncbi:MAG: ABC transporter permease [candidate division NC10 bacterium]|nr:ABC transporter permease [candidate division NC10 bacterium]
MAVQVVETLRERHERVAPGGELADLWRRLRRNRAAMAGAAVVVVFVLLALFAPVLVPFNPTQGNLNDRLQPPSAAHWLGTDELGRDVFSRILFGARISLQIQIVAVVLALVVGVALGSVGGYLGGHMDNIIMRAMDVLLAFPGIFLALAIIAALGPGLLNLMLAAGISSVPQFARIVRASILSLKEREFVEAALALGSGSGRVMFRHILPNCLAPIIVQSTLRMATVLLTASGLSFLGLGVQPPTPEWGAMLSNAPASVSFPSRVLTPASPRIFLDRNTNFRERERFDTGFTQAFHLDWGTCGLRDVVDPVELLARSADGFRDAGGRNADLARLFARMRMILPC